MAMHWCANRHGCSVSALRATILSAMLSSPPRTKPGALPLLADLFSDLWERMRERGDGTLRVSDSREIIQVGGALSKRADAFLAQHPNKVEAAKRLFTLRLAHVPRNGEPVRARRERDIRGNQGQEIDAEWALVELLAGPDWRLVVTGEKDGKIMESLISIAPTNTVWRDSLSVTYNKVGAIQECRGEMDGALFSYGQALSIRNNLLAQNPRDFGTS